MPAADLDPSTSLVTLGRPPAQPDAPVTAPIVLSSTFHAGGANGYGRFGNPVWTAFEEVLGALEGGRAITYASGLGAADAVLSLVPPGGVVVAPAAAYNGLVSTLSQRASRGELEVRWVDQQDQPQVAAALEGADLLWLESPTNPLLDVADVASLSQSGHRAGALVAVDNTFATPLLQRPLELGADLVVHSATKYLSGHSDVLLGAVVTPDTPQGEVLAEQLVAHRTLRGGVPGPVETWLALRGVRTLAVRLERACANAAELAARLASHPAVALVRYPGFGAMVSIEVLGGSIAADRVCAGVRLWVHATSLGGVESSLERRRAIATEPITTPDNLVRLSVGIEAVDDLWRDLAAALDLADLS